MTAKDELEGQRSCRGEWIGRQARRNKSNAVNAAALQRIWRDFLRDECAGALTLHGPEYLAPDEFPKTCAGMKQPVPI
jgi:hypothetical protein